MLRSRILPDFSRWKSSSDLKRSEYRRGRPSVGRVGTGYPGSATICHDIHLGLTMARSKTTGFTLVEIAVVLFIIALITAGGIGLASSLRTAASQKSSLQNAETIKIALQNFISRNGRLPCPAVEGDVPTAATFGIEAVSAAPGDCTGVVGVGPGPVTPAVSGVVPWKTLGLTFDATVDGWGNQFTYVVTRSATSLTQQTLAGMRGNLTVHSDVPIVNGLPTDLPPGNQLNACKAPGNVQGCEFWAVAVLISHGANMLGARSREGVATPPTVADREKENTNNDLAFVSREISDGAATQFDDIVIPLSPNDLLSALYAQGLKNEQFGLLEKRRQLVSSLAAAAAAAKTTTACGSGPTPCYPLPAPTGVTVAYTFSDASKFTDCLRVPPVLNSVLSLPNSLQSVLDPWGIPFAYQRAEDVWTASETCASPVVLVSAGPDKLFGTTDDIVYYVPGPEFNAALMSML